MGGRTYTMWSLALLLLTLASIQGQEETEPQEELVGLDGVPYAREVCYEDLGCFSSGGDFGDDRYVNLLPASPGKINTQFVLHTHHNPSTADGAFIAAHQGAELLKSPFSANRSTKMIIHGFLESGFTDWVHEMRRDLLLHGDYNVIQVDWAGGNKPPYTQATANTRVVGAEIARLIEVLQEQFGVGAETFHLIGHSLGAHTSGYAGTRIANLGRITGMDPAGPYFEDTSATVRLDYTDAQFVEAIHTDTRHIVNSVLLRGGFGIEQPVGDVDFYMNGGKVQPNCNPSPIRDILKEGLVDGLGKTVACSHMRSHELVAESINSNCPFRAYPCQSWDVFRSGKCLRCDAYHVCQSLGGFPNPSIHAGNDLTLFSMTGGETPYCRYHYSVSVTISGAEFSSSSQAGWPRVRFHGSKGELEHKFTKDLDSSKSLEIQPGTTYTALVTSSSDLGDLQGASVWWECDSDWWNLFSYCWLRSTKVNFDQVQILQGESQNEYTFCAKHQRVEPKSEIAMLPSASAC